ncbi:MAG: hypothetical protein K2H31_07750 [Lachnospiraceae bacterium]|nr:hypothetical protein [Lachnospiraceae bacterium]
MTLSSTLQIVCCIIVTLAVFMPPVLTSKWNKKRLSLRIETEDCFFLRCSPMFYILGIIATVLVYFCSMIMLFVVDVWDSGLLLGEFIALAITFFEMYVMITTLLWEVKVEPDAITLYRFPLPVKRFNFYDITSVRYMENLRRGGAIYIGGKMQLIFYHNGKKLFDVDSDMNNFQRLLELMESKKRIECGFLIENGVALNEWKDEFTVAETTADKLRAAFGALLACGLLIGGIFYWEEIKEDPYCLFYCIAFSLIFIVEISEFLEVMMKKVTITYQDIHVRSGIGKVCSYRLRDITRIEEKDAFIILYVNGKKIAKISKAEKNFARLAERLKSLPSHIN